MDKQRMTEQLRLFNSNYISRQTLKRYFLMGDSFNEQEMDIVINLIPFDNSDCVSINDLVEFMYK